MVTVLHEYNLADFLVFGVLSFVLGFFVQAYYREAQHLLIAAMTLVLVFLEFLVFAFMWGVGLVRDVMGWGLRCSLIIIEFSKFSLKHQNDSMAELQCQRENISAEIHRKYSNTGRQLKPEAGRYQENEVVH
jgi:vacuolar-type H+-ATPase subunit I/STV1